MDIHSERKGLYTLKKLTIYKYIVLIISSLTLLTITSMGAVTLSVMSKNTIDSTYDLLKSQLNGISTTMEHVIPENMNALQQYSNDDHLFTLLTSDSKDVLDTKKTNITTLRDTYNQYFKQMIDSNEYYLNFFVLNLDGMIYASCFPEAVGTDVSTRSYFTDAVAQNKNILGDIVYSDRVNAYVNMFAVPIHYHGELVGVMVAAVDSRLFQQTILEFADSNSEFYITDSVGNVVFCPDMDYLGEQFITPELIQLATDPDLTLGHMMLYSHGKEVVFYDRLPDYGWTIYSVEAYNHIYKPVKEMIIKATITGIIILLIALCIIVVIGKTFSTPLYEMQTATTNIASGKLNTVISTQRKSQEFLDLSKNINLMAQQLSKLIASTSTTISRVEDASTNLCAVSEEVHASATEVDRKVAYIVERTLEQNDTVRASSHEMQDLGNRIEILAQKNETMKAQNAMVNESLIANQSMLATLTEDSKKSSESSQKVTEQVSSLIEQITKVADIVSMIENISSQTSLLSLNASIEAARAGEAGRGFAVVASEIRSLADEVQSSVNSITSLLSDVSTITEETKRTITASDAIAQAQLNSFYSMEHQFSVMLDTVDSMRKITEEINQNVQQVNEKKDFVLTHMDHITSGSVEVADMIQQTSDSIKEQTKAFEEVSIQAEELIQHTLEVKESINKFTL